MPTPDSSERYPLHNKVAEQAVIGSMMIGGMDAVMLVRDTLRPSDFYLTAHQWIVEAIYRLYDDNKPIDTLTLDAQLERDGRDDQTMITVLTCLNEVPTYLNIAEYAASVVEMSTRRSMVGVASQIATLAHDVTGDVSRQMDAAEGAIMRVRERQASQNIGHPRVYTSEYMDEIIRRSKMDRPLAGLATSISEWDAIMSGLESGQVHIVAARPKMGKTGLCMQVARHNAMQGKSVLYFSLEMTKDQMTTRNMAAITGIPSQRLRVGRLEEVEWPIFYDALGKVSQTKLFIDDTRGLSPAQLNAKARRVWMEHSLDLIVVDYIGLMSPPRNYNGNRNAELTEISAALTATAGDLNVPILAASQLSRGVEARGEKRPMLSDLRDSGSLEQDAYTVTFIYRDEYYNPETTSKPGIAELIVAANRGGPSGNIEVSWRGDSVTFGHGNHPSISPAIQQQAAVNGVGKPLRF